MDDVKDKVELLLNKDNTKACGASKQLEERSKENSDVYDYMDKFIEMLESDNSYVRNRGICLIASNAQWDKENKINKAINNILIHITDEKPITARQFVKALPVIAEHKPELKDIILNKLKNADVSFYKDSMRGLVEKDIKEAIGRIQLF